MDNIRYGKLDATDDEVYAAAKLAHADQFIQMLPNGYDTMLSGDGEELSQGQRQLLSIARAAVADPPVLILDEATSSIDTRTESIVQKGMDNLSTGERNYSYPYSLMEEDADAYVQKYVLPRYTKSLKKLFAGKDPSAPAINDNITAMKQIKELCDANDVTLKVVIGPTFLAEMYKFEGQEYYNYLRELVQITDIWDFSGFLLENRNPYNFVNEGHYKNVVADLMVNIMYGKTERDGFGILLTKDNIEDYLAKRQADYEELKQEYEATGNVALETANNASYISSAM